MTRPEEQRSGHSVERRLERVLAASTIILMWSASIFLVSRSSKVKVPALSDLATLLFGATSIALFLLSLMVAVLAIIGWQEIQKRLKHVDTLEGEVRAQVTKLERDTENRLAELTAEVRAQSESIEKEKFIPLKNELLGRVHSLLGFIMGELSMDRNSFQVEDPDQMREAITLCQQGYDLLKKVGGPAEFMALNNLIFYSCLIEDISRGRFILEQGRRLLMAAQEHQAINILVTACRAILQFSSDTEEKKEALAILATVGERSHATETQKKEASLYLASFSHFSENSQPTTGSSSKDPNR